MSGRLDSIPEDKFYMKGSTEQIRKENEK